MDTDIINKYDCNPININDINWVKERMLLDSNITSLVDLFKLLSNQTRVTILWALSKKELCVCDLAVLLNMSKSAISHQLRVLRHNKIVKVRQSGTHMYYSIANEYVILLLQTSNNLINEGVDI